MLLGGIAGFLALIFLFDIATEVTKIRKLLDQEAKRRDVASG